MNKIVTIFISLFVGFIITILLSALILLGIRSSNQSRKISELETQVENLEITIMNSETVFEEYFGVDLDTYISEKEEYSKSVFVFFEVGTSESTIFEFRDLVLQNGDYESEYTSTVKANEEWAKSQDHQIDIDLPANIRFITSSNDEAKDLEKLIYSFESEYGVYDVKIGSS